MVLSNKKLKQKLRAAKAELLAASEAGNQFTRNDSKDPEGLYPKPQESLRTLLKKADQKPRLSKREKQRVSKAQSLKENPVLSNGDDNNAKSGGGSEGLVEEEKKKSKKRKKGQESGGLENVEDKEANKLNKKVKRNRKEKGKKSRGDEEVNESVENGEAKKKAESLKDNSVTESGSNGESGGGFEGLDEEEKKGKKGEGEGPESGGLGNVEAKEKNKSKKKAKQNKKKNRKKSGEAKKTEEDMESGLGGTSELGAGEATRSNDSYQNVEVSTKVYVGGIPYYSSEDDIRSYFESCGTITDIDCMKFPESGKFRGIAIIAFKTEAAAKRALNLDGSDMGGLFLKIQPYKSTKVSKDVPSFSPGIVEGYNRIYVGNLSWDITEDDLKALFSGCNITSIRFGEDKETGEFRGYAHVDFADNPSLNMALKLDQKIVCGRPVRISCAVPRKGGTSNPRPITTNKVATANAMSMPENNEVTANSMPTPETNQAGENGASAGNAKMRRRTCYDCGERGHISSSCPKKQDANQSNPNAS